MERDFDVVVIGSGSAAKAAAYPARTAGRSVAMMDSRPFGGTCALRGCDPKKVLVGAAEAIDWNQRMQNKGIRNEGRKNIDKDWHDLMQFKRTFTEPVPKEREESYSKAGITAFHGTAQFIASNT